MKKLTLLLVLVISSITTIAQYDVEAKNIKVSRDYDLENEGVPIVISTGNMGALAYTLDLENGLKVGYLNDDFEWKNPPLSLELDKHETQEFVNIYERGSKVYVVSHTTYTLDEDDTDNEKDYGKAHVFYTAFDLVANTVSEPVELMEFTFKRTSEVFSVESLNKNYTLIGKYESNKDGELDYSFLVLNKDFQEENSVESKLTVKEGEYKTIKSVQVSNAGHIAMMTYSNYFPNRDGYKYLVTVEHVEIQYFAEESSKVKSFHIEFDDKKQNITDDGCQMTLDENGFIYLAGTYSYFTVYPRGLFHIKIDTETEKIEWNYQDWFSEEFVLLGLTDPKHEERAKKNFAKGKHVSLAAFLVERLLVNADGSITLVLEEYILNKEEYNDKNKDLFGSLLFVKFNREGTSVEWNALVEKKQFVDSEDENIHASNFDFQVLDNGDYVLVYNEGTYFDSPMFEELEDKSQEIPNLMVTVISPKGETSTKSLLLDSKEEGVLFGPAWSSKIGPQKLYLVGISEEKGVFVLVDF